MLHRSLVSSCCVAFAVAIAVGCSSSGTPDSAAPVEPGTNDPDAGEAGTDPDAAVGKPGAPGECTVTKPGKAGLLLQGRVLLPAGPIDGEVLIAAAGTITCADKSCAKCCVSGDVAITTPVPISVNVCRMA